MRSLKLDVIRFQHLPMRDGIIARCVHVEDTYFVLKDNFVHLLKDNHDCVIGIDIKTIDWIPMENILYMGNGDKFICYNIVNEQISNIVIEGGYLIHKWNPSEDRVALIDNNGILKIVLLDSYNSHCTFVGEYKLDNIEKSPFINIGWGSQKSQFRGSEGKYTEANKTSSRESIFKREHTMWEENSIDNINNDNSLRIAWRDDGDIFAVSFTCQEQRIFKVFTCECEFLYESELTPGMSSEITWKPDGSLIATENHSSSGRQIRFYEKNGLHRYDMQLPSNNYVKKLEWNSTGDILMIWQESSDYSEISFWTCTNFKWYLKQNLLHDKDNLVTYVSWSDVWSIEIITAKNIVKYRWKWVTLKSQKLPKNADDLGIITVIDGNLLRVSVTSAQIIPPPHSSYNIEFSKPINFVVFGNSHNTLAVILNDYTFKILEISKSDYVEKFTGNIPYNSVPLALNNFVFDDKKSCLYYVESLADNQSSIYKLDFDISTNKISQQKYFHAIDNICDLLQICGPEKSKYLGVCAEGRVTLCYPDEQSNMLLSDLNLELFKNEDEKGGNCSVLFLLDSYHTFSLNGQNFYYNGEKVANNITSYSFCPNYLLLTNNGSKLLCIKLNKKGLKNLETKNLTNVYARSIPSGALLISVVPNARKIILQIPRGELEIINPRVLAIDEIDHLLTNKKHLEAYLIMRTDRINPNLLYDLNPTRFLNDIEDFIRNVRNCEYLDVFLTQLQDYNVSEELYRNCFEEHLPMQTGSKLFLVLDKFIEAMKMDVDYYLQSIVTAFVCKGTDEDLEKALEEASLAKKREENGIKMRISADSILEHMIILSSVEKLYDISLAMDNLNLIMWVASKSQLDPLEYIPFLRELVAMEHNYRNYKINYHIKRFEQAFTFLIKCDNVLDELKELISKNSLYTIILKHVRPVNQWYKPLLQLYGKYLNEEKHYKEAGSVFMRIEEYKAAFENFVKDCCMKEALTAFFLLGSDVVKMHNSLVELANKLIDNKQFQEASYIYNTVLNNYEESISVLLKGCFWSDALYLAHKNNRRDIIESEIKPAVLDHSDSLYDNFKMYKEEFVTLKSRLKTIRSETVQKFRENGDFIPNGDYENTNDFNSPNIDLESVVSTTYSQTKSQKSKSSHMTSASSRRRKRIEKKVLQIREGSAFENVAIIRRLHIIISEIQNSSQTVSDTCLQLILYPEFYEKAVQLHSLYGELTNLTELSKDVIWSQEIVSPPKQATVESQVYRMNLEHLENQYRWPPQKMKQNWKIFGL